MSNELKIDLRNAKYLKKDSLIMINGEFYPLQVLKRFIAALKKLDYVITMGRDRLYIDWMRGECTIDKLENDQININAETYVLDKKGVAYSIKMERKQ